MSSNDDDEPVFRRSRWGANRYEYNPANPLGAVLIGLTVLLAAGMFYLIGNHIGPFALPSDHPDTPSPTESPWTDDPDMP